MIRTLIARYRKPKQVPLRPDPDHRARSLAQMDTERRSRRIAAIGAVFDPELAKRADRDRRERVQAAKNWTPA